MATEPTTPSFEDLPPDLQGAIIGALSAAENRWQGFAEGWLADGQIPSASRDHLDLKVNQLRTLRAWMRLPVDADPVPLIEQALDLPTVARGAA